ncbi:unnamed protein product [Zymoseptoria tritici ST99CH_3D7]|uniref:Uncharacterized protein n=1 Tax=Zymoseptoria tritici (strain ST99CH_3D7) TaxID=1276538 RepID=A0A1X7RS76_ZYMT9|nr:unnamed protein product [Zymoseptoria tritici ST99CH_3D7]
MLAPFHPNTIVKLVKATVYITLLVNEQYTRNRRRGYLNKIAENEAYRKFIGSSKSWRQADLNKKRAAELAYKATKDALRADLNKDLTKTAAGTSAGTSAGKGKDTGNP